MARMKRQEQESPKYSESDCGTDDNPATHCVAEQGSVANCSTIHNDTEEEAERREVEEEMVVDSNQDSHPIATPESLTSNKTRMEMNRRRGE